MDEVAVIADPGAAGVSLDPVRARLLAELVEPGSATTLARKLGLPRQKVNYHLHALERHGLVELVEERRKGNVNERWLRAVASSYVISPAVLGAITPDPDRSADKLSARWLLALSTRLLRELAELVTGASKANKPLATFGIDGDIRFASAKDRQDFAEELTKAVTKLVSKYHDEKAPGGRPHRIVVAIHPKIQRSKEKS